MEDSGRSPQAGRATHERSQVTQSPPTVSVPNAGAKLRENADALHQWLGSFDEHVRQASDRFFGPGYGIEEKVNDLFQITGRLAASIGQGLRDAASAIEAQRAATAQTGAVHEDEK